MKNKSILSILLLSIAVFGCNDPSEKKNNQPQREMSEIDAIVTAEIASHRLSASKEVNKLEILKSIIQEKKTGNQNIDSVTIIQLDSIEKYLYIKNMFPINEIDSIEFYGPISRNYFNPRHLPLNTLLILYFNNQVLSNQELDSLNNNWKINFRATEGMFKAGGIAFELNNQLCIYSVNTCGPGYKYLQKTDTLINKEVFNNEGYMRLHAGCGMSPFKRMEK